MKRKQLDQTGIALQKIRVASPDFMRVTLGGIVQVYVIHPNTPKEKQFTFLTLSSSRPSLIPNPSETKP